MGTKHIPLLETLPENIACLAFLFVAGGFLLAAILSSQLTTSSADHSQRFPQRRAPRIGDELDDSFVADGLVEPVGLGLGALVGPDEGGAEDVAIGVEHDAAVHLAGEADGLDADAF